jgi:uncharacterized protein
MECLRCGTCCVAPDISTLGKGIGERCLHLSDGLSCRNYQERPAVCRGYRSDEICRLFQAPSLELRVAGYLKVFGIEEALQGEVAVEPLPVGELADPVPQRHEETPVMSLQHRKVVVPDDDGLAAGGKA